MNGRCVPLFKCLGNDESEESRHSTVRWKIELGYIIESRTSSLFLLAIYIRRLTKSPTRPAYYTLRITNAETTLVLLQALYSPIFFLLIDGHVHLGVKSIVDKCRHQVVLPAPLQKPSLVSAVRNEDAPSFRLRDCKFLLSSQVSESSRVRVDSYTCKCYEHVWATARDYLGDY